MTFFNAEYVKKLTQGNFHIKNKSNRPKQYTQHNQL